MKWDNVEEFYPTPETLLEEITKEIDFKKITSILEPSAGSGNIIEFCLSKCKKYYYDNIDIDCIEIDKDLQKVLLGKNFRLISDDFLNFKTFKKYDLIFMNPPFSNGASHLLKAIDLQPKNIICILNAETIKNPYTKERQILKQKLIGLNANITFMESAFSNAERQTNVEVAVIKLSCPQKEYKSYILEELEKKYYKEGSYIENTDVAPNDFVEAIIRKYELEVEAGLNLIKEYRAMQPLIMNSIKKNEYGHPLIELKVSGNEVSENEFVKCVREKYWNALFNNERFTKGMPSDLLSEYHNMVTKLREYDFSIFNINKIRNDIERKLCSGIEECIMKLFDELSYTYSWHRDNPYEQNIHYFNGWASNKCWKISEKVILPCYDVWRYGRMDLWRVSQKISDMEKAFDYLLNGTTDFSTINALRHAESIQQSRNLQLKYFNVSFYKKGTMHITFKDGEIQEKALKALNIFGARNRNWLPPGYGKTKYSDLSETEKKVIDEFDGGEDGYNQVCENSDLYIRDFTDMVHLIA